MPDMAVATSEMATPRAPPSTPSTPSARRARKSCSHGGCSKVDAGGGFCVAHGGGKKCAFPGCSKGYQTGGYCRKHGGGARCQVPGCAKVDAGKGLCRAHGGGRRCQSPGCPKADVGGGFCTAHGGGKRCSEPGCSKIDQGGGKCRAHGGAKRCKKPDCTQPARGATGFCSDHGGARVCATANCRRLARVGTAAGELCATCAKEAQTASYASPIPFPDAAASLAMPLTHQLRIDTGRHTANLENDLSLHGDTKPATSEGLKATCAGAEVASCLDNGCSRSFGGRCNCVENCTCNHSSPTSSTSFMLGQQSADAPKESQEIGCIRRYLLQVEAVEGSTSIGLPANSLVAMVSALPGVRSTHVLEEVLANALEEKSAHNLPNNQDPFQLVVRGNGSLDLEKLLQPLNSSGLCRLKIIEEATVPWPQSEVVIAVEGMMCPGNCGATVMAAIRGVEKVSWASLVFEARQVVVRGEMQVSDLCEAVKAVGFDAYAVETSPLPRRYRLRAVEPWGTAKAQILKEILLLVEGVEEIMLLVESAEILAVATIPNPLTLIDAAMRGGFTLLDVSDDRVHSTPTSPPSLTWSPGPDTSIFVSSPSARLTAEEIDPSHTCDSRTCPQNMCPRYMMTVAHAAALAVGWSVPGCGMASGRECTCGDSCKCKGCPQHNPAT